MFAINWPRIVSCESDPYANMRFVGEFSSIVQCFCISSSSMMLADAPVSLLIVSDSVFGLGAVPTCRIRLVPFHGCLLRGIVILDKHTRAKWLGLSHFLQVFPIAGHGPSLWGHVSPHALLTLVRRRVSLLHREFTWRSLHVELVHRRRELFHPTSLGLAHFH